MLTLKHQQAMPAVRGSARVQSLEAPQAGQREGVVMGLALSSKVALHDTAPTHARLLTA